MPKPAAQVRADDEPVSLHFTQVLSEHFLRRLREHPAQLAQSHGSSLETGENSDFPLSLNERDCELNGLVFFGWALMIKRLSFLPFVASAYPFQMDMGSRTRVRHDFVALLA